MRCAVINRQTLIVDNIIVAVAPNEEFEDYIYVTLDSEAIPVKIGWTYDSENYRFLPPAEEQLTEEQNLELEELAWKAMLEDLMTQESSDVS